MTLRKDVFTEFFFSKPFHNLTKIFQVGKDYRVLLVADRDEFFLPSLAFGTLLWPVLGIQRMPGGVTFPGKVQKPCSVNADCSSTISFSTSVLCSLMNIARGCHLLNFFIFSQFFLVSYIATADRDITVSLGMLKFSILWLLSLAKG